MRRLDHCPQGNGVSTGYRLWLRLPFAVSQPLVAHHTSWARPTAKPVRLPPPIGADPNRVKSLIGRTATVFCIDDSGSMYGNFADERGVRYAAAKSLTNMMGRCGGGRAAVIHWGTDAPEDQALRLTDIRRAAWRINRALRIPPTLGGTTLLPALQRVTEVLADARPDERPVVFVLTDGYAHISTEAITTISRLPAECVHVLLVDHCPERSAAADIPWLQLPLGSFRRLDTFNTAQLARELAEVVADTLGLQMPPEPIAITSQKVS